VRNQEALQKALQRRGFKVGQATLSRDIRELNLAKTAAGYSLGENGGGAHAGLPPTSRLIKEFLLEVRAAQNLLILKTVVGSAQPGGGRGSPGMARDCRNHRGRRHHSGGVPG